MKANIVKLQRFSTHDGPGVRTVVFFKGCPLRCRWCHNPETQRSESEIIFQKNQCIGCGACEAVCENHAHTLDDADMHSYDASKCTGCMRCADACVTGAIESVGRRMSIGEIIDTVLRDRAFYGDTGGITLSGGEPMLQPDACIGLMRAAKDNGMTTAIETCGYFPGKYIDELAEVTNYFLWDFKCGSSEKHREYTGVGNDAILRNLYKTDAYAKHIILRCIMVRGVNMDEDSLKSIAEAYHKLSHCDGVTLIPYHAYGGSKSEQLGGTDNGNTAWIPTDGNIAGVRDTLLRYGVKVK